ncbi:hydrolase [Legionella jamestowniensis]|uniref:Carboxypeptidase G2 n=1 Tax=Legionella jamestowniensis TaxID=455 RepID=A0A0W0UJQ2_9GAMM|nr:hydrolase [Legionella jamestowniensis]KTD08129.1 carboxypeptidase G2 [Legionella jamestowniensis]SFM08853.1 glutamate carboxypeptidase [Legionella jamestowniensis DSM 19215]
MDHALNGLLSRLHAEEKCMIAQLHQFCSINSGTENLQGLAQMSQALEAAFKPLADDIQRPPLPMISTVNMKGETITQRCGDILFIRKRPELKRRILLSGHMDTVFAANHPFQELTYVNENHLNGPGVTDMKGGLIVMLHALNAFEEMTSANKLGWDVVINADEEIGSPASSTFFDEIAADYQTALVYEPAMDSKGNLAKNRRGSGKLTLIATGKAAHAGRAFYEGRNAISYLAEAIVAIHALNGLRENVTINVGKIAGGEALNVVPDKAVAKLDVRIEKNEDEQWVRNQLHAIIEKMRREDYSLTLHGSFGRPVKRVCPATEKLFARIQRLGHLLNLSIHWEDSGGCCDGNNLAHHGLAVIDTLGVRGGNIHSSSEYILLDSLVERAALSTLLLHDLAQGGLEELRV